MDAVILPASASEADITAAGGPDKVYLEYDFEWLVNEAKVAEEYRHEMESNGLAPSTVEKKVREFCIGRKHSLYNGVPYCKQALEGVPDPLHVDCNEMKYLLELCNSYCATLGKNEDEFRVESADTYIGQSLRNFWEAMVNVGLKDEQTRLENRRLAKQTTATPTEFRVTGTKSTRVMRSFAELTDALGKGRQDYETDYERFTRGMLHLSFLFLRVMSTLYSKFSITKGELTKLGVVGRDYFALKVLSGLKCGPNEHTMCYAIHYRLEKYFDTCRIRDGVSLGGGVLGSCQGLEGKHWFTRASIASNTSLRRGCWREEQQNSGLRMIYGEVHLPVPVNYGRYKYIPRIPDRVDVHQCIVCRKVFTGDSNTRMDDKQLAFAKEMLLLEQEPFLESILCGSCELACEVFWNVVKPRGYSGWCRDAVLSAGSNSANVIRIAESVANEFELEAETDAYMGGLLHEPPVSVIFHPQIEQLGSSSSVTVENDDLGLAGVNTLTTEELEEAFNAVDVDEEHDVAHNSASDSSDDGGSVPVDGTGVSNPGPMLSLLLNDGQFEEF